MVNSKSGKMRPADIFAVWPSSSDPMPGFARNNCASAVDAIDSLYRNAQKKGTKVMRKLSVFVAALIALSASESLAQSSYLSIPASSFTPRESGGSFGYGGNDSGTARFFGERGFLMFAPVNLPHRARVASLACGGRAPTDVSLQFVLRRNQPQQANVDMATVETEFADSSFKNLRTSEITGPRINNLAFNYYIVASWRHIDVDASCTGCSIGYCRIRYTGG